MLGIKIELTTGQKLQMAFIVAVLGFAAFMIVRSTRPVLDGSVNAWTQEWHYQVDLSKPLDKVKNPEDPKKLRVVNIFACYDGQLEITEFKNDPTKHPTIAWFKVDPRRKSYIYYRDPMAPVKALSDPYPHAIALASYSAANGRPLGLLADAGLTADQLKAEKQARDAMNDAVTVIKMEIENGAFKQKVMDKVMAALDAFRRTDGDPMKDKAKADKAREVLVAASEYMKEVEAAKSAAIEKYIAKMGDILTADQKAKLVTAAANYESRSSNRNTAPAARTGRTTPAAQKPAAK